MSSEFGNSFEEAVFFMAPHNPTLFRALDKLAYVGADAVDEGGISPEEREEETGEKEKEDKLVSPKERTNRLRKTLAKREADKKKAIKGETGVTEQHDRKEDLPVEKVARLNRIAYLSH